MAVIRLEQRGLSLVARSARLVVTVNRPRVKPIYDQCGILDYVKTAGSYAISGRATCEDRMVDIMRCSYSYLQKAPAIADIAGDITFENARATANIFVETPFGGAEATPGTPAEITQVQAFYTLEDQCKDPIGNVEENNFNRFLFTTDCRLSLLTSFTSKLALNTDLAVNAAQMHTVLGGFFKAPTKVGGEQATTTAAWLALADVDITLNIPGMESVRINSEAPNAGA